MPRALSLFCLLALAGALGLVLGQHDTTSRSAQDAWKAAHARKVADELSQRDVRHLTAAQREARATLLGELRTYGEAGRFAQNEDYPGEAIPHLIDRHGTRCALANLIDRSGHPELLQRLAATDNIAFVPALSRDAELSRWLGAHGLTLEEAAYIQGPGFVDGPPRDIDDIRGDPTSPVTPSPNVPTTGGPSTQAPSVGGSRRGRRAGNSVARWDTWWRLNRHAFLNLRARYHDGLVLTGERSAESTGRRPSTARVEREVLPTLKALATGEDKSVRATALMAWARAARPAQAQEVIAATKAYVGNKENQWRELMLLAMGIVQHADGVAPLAAVLADTKEGRALLAKKGSIPDRTRAYAAVALGQSGQPEAKAHLMAVLQDNRTKSVDLKACAVMALGTLARDLDAGERRRVGAFLVKNLRAGAWSDVVLAMVPAALSNAGDDVVLQATLQPVLERFRKPTQVRQSSALALATGSTKSSEGMLDTLIATARRDPDDNARRFGIVALGEAAAHADEAGQKKLARYYQGAFAGRNIQKTDLPWLCLSAALYGRVCKDEREMVRKELSAIATKGSAKDRQAAAVVGLGLLGDAEAIPTLRTLQGKTKDKLIRGYLVETLGILGDKQGRDELLALVREDGSGAVRYQAALGLGFAADPALVDPLVETLATTPSQDAKRALARVIGELGDRRALPALLQVATDSKADVWTRRRALGAIGMIAQAEDHAWVTAFQRGVNWPAATPTLREILSLF